MLSGPVGGKFGEAPSEENAKVLQMSSLKLTTTLPLKIDGKGQARAYFLLKAMLVFREGIFFFLVFVVFCPSNFQLMVNSWFGAQWFGFRLDPRMKGIVT